MNTEVYEVKRFLQPYYHYYYRYYYYYYYYYYCYYRDICEIYDITKGKNITYDQYKTTREAVADIRKGYCFRHNEINNSRLGYYINC